MPVAAIFSLRYDTMACMRASYSSMVEPSSTRSTSWKQKYSMPSFSMISKPASALALARSTASDDAFHGNVFVPPPNWSAPSAQRVCHHAIEKRSQSFILRPLTTRSGS